MSVNTIIFSEDPGYGPVSIPVFVQIDNNGFEFRRDGARAFRLPGFWRRFYAWGIFVVFHEIDRGKIVLKYPHFLLDPGFRFLSPELLIPGFMLFAGHFPVSGGSVKALVTKVLLEETETIAGIIAFYGINGKGIPELVRGDVVDLTGFRIYKLWQPGFFGAFFNYLPGSMAIYAEEKSPSVSNDEAAKTNMFFEKI